MGEAIKSYKEMEIQHPQYYIHGQRPKLFEKADKFDKADQIRALGLYPYFRAISSAQDTMVQMNGNKVSMLGSNSYLGLTTHPKVKEAAINAAKKYGTGCAGSRLLNGTLDIHIKLEEKLAEFVGKEAALLYSTGFQTNLGVISTMVGRKDYVLEDRNNHASLVCGGMLSMGEMIRFDHNNMNSLEQELKRIDNKAGILIAVDGVFSMEGDIANLPAICNLAQKYGAAIMVDDAHSIGVLGEKGAGTASHFSLTNRIDLIMGTFSKSLASLGGFIASDAKTIDYLKHNSHPLIFSASMTPASAASALAAIEVMESEPEIIEQLWRNTCHMKEGLSSLGYNLGKSETPILPVYIGDKILTFRMCKELEREGIFINPIVSPSVPEGKELIRVSLMATHTPEQIDFTLEKFKKAGKNLGII